MRWEPGIEDGQLVAFLDHVPIHVTITESVDPVGNLHSGNCSHPLLLGPAQRTSAGEWLVTQLSRRAQPWPAGSRVRVAVAAFATAGSDHAIGMPSADCQKGSWSA